MFQIEGYVASCNDRGEKFVDLLTGVACQKYEFDTLEEAVAAIPGIRDSWDEEFSDPQSSYYDNWIDEIFVWEDEPDRPIGRDKKIVYRTL